MGQNVKYRENVWHFTCKVNKDQEYSLLKGKGQRMLR
jgi:ureidoglycolate hydrolase